MPSVLVKPIHHKKGLWGTGGTLDGKQVQHQPITNNQIKRISY